MTDDGFTSFLCDHCHTEIEATLDLVGQETECPACGAKLSVPPPVDDDGVKRHAAGDMDPTLAQATKSRTIRIELGDI